MKTILLCVAITLRFVMANAQSPSSIREGTRLSYTVYPPGIIYPVTFTLDSVATNYMKFSWLSASGSSGKYVLESPNRAQAEKAFWGPPDHGQEITLEPGYTLLLLSQKQWNDLSKTQQTLLDGMIYKQALLTPARQISIDGKPLDAIYLESADQSAQLWVLNNPQFPIFLKMVNNPRGVDLVLNNIE